ncbi:MAG: hypothetical protein J1F02_06895 [Lachnospiraceae bacterium]|nr:hypothetical protein [Lachnospiraceae bacterium]
MKRICTEAEKELLYKNRGQMLEGIYQTASKSKLSYIFIGIFLSAIAMLAVTFLIAAIFEFKMSKIVLAIVMMFLFFLFYAIFAAILNTFRINKEKKNFIKKENLKINGATLVAMESENCFIYIEDDVLDKTGKPIIFEYPSRVLEMSREDEGKRCIVLYDSDSNFQLVRVNEELSGLIPNDSSDYPLTGEYSEYTRLPHPNVENVERDGRPISEGEKEKFADLYVKVVRSVSSRFIKKGVIALAILAVIICVLLDNVEGGYPLEKTLPIAGVVWGGYVLLLFVISALGKQNLRRQGRKLVYVKEVVFHSYIMDVEGSSATVKVYEWKDGQVQLCEYWAGNVAMNTVYGSILYKFTNQKGDTVLLNTSPVEKKHK